jgi:hypothetical protein
MSQGDYIARTIDWQGMKLVNICDEELLGTVVEGENLNMKISREYFGGQKVSREHAIALIKSATIINLAGSRIVEQVINEKLAASKAVKRVGSVSFLMIYKFSP